MPPSPLWPENTTMLPAQIIAELTQTKGPLFLSRLQDLQLPTTLTQQLPLLYLPLANWLQQQRQPSRPLLVGINGAQGSGKTTLSELLKLLLTEVFNCHCCTISIDDFYLSKADRLQLAADIHPLFATRGVPGTHDITLGKKVFDQLKAAKEKDLIAIPRFDKAQDDRIPQKDWVKVNGPPDVILFEGWCVGATAQPEEALDKPINRLEATEDVDGHWRRYVNQKLQSSYQSLFKQLDLLIFLKIPSWERVYHWRKKQEEQLATRQRGDGIMNASNLQRFIMHYERLTQHQLAVLPQRADLVLGLNNEQQVSAIQIN